MEKIKEIWFDRGRIYMRSEAGHTFSRPLEAFPLLKDASSAQREQFYIWGNGEYVRWKSLDEDLSVAQFMETTEPDLNNEVAHIFRRCPWLDIAEAAKFIGMPKAVLDRFIYGIWQPKEETLAAIKSGIKAMSMELAAAAG